MRVLHLSALYPPHIVGGAEKSVELLARSQCEAGMTVAAACISPQACAPTMRKGVTVYRMPHENLFWLEDWPQYSRLARNWQKLRQQWNYRIERRFCEVLEDFEPDIVHTHSLLDISPLVWRAAARRRVPIVHTLRDYALVCANAAMFRHGAPCARLHLKCAAMTGVSWLMQHHVVSVAGVGKDILERHLRMGLFRHIPAARRRVIWNAAAPDSTSLTPRKPGAGGELVFGYLGRINPEKGVGTLLEACGELPQAGWRLDIAGEAPGGTASFADSAAGLPVRFRGFVDPAAFLRSIDVLVVPSIWAEPLPRTILEAYAAQVPVIGSRSGGIPDLIGHDNDGWLFDAGNAAMLAARMREVMRMPRHTLRQQDFSRVLSEIAPATVTAKYRQLYEQTLEAAVW